MFRRHFEELRRLYGKFREGTLTMEEALGGIAFFYTVGPFLIISLISEFLIDTEMEWMDDRRAYFLGIPRK